MIIVKGREMLIPNNERYIGTIYDDRSENRQFQIPRFSERGVDLSAFTFRLDIEYPDETTDTALLDVSIDDEHILATWEITNAQVGQPGTMFIQIRAADENFTAKWSTFRAALYVEDHINTPATYSGDLSELEMLEAQFAQIYNSEATRVANERERETAEEDREDRMDTAIADGAARLDEAIAQFNLEREDLYRYMMLSRSWAVGGTETREGEDTNNSEYWARQAAADEASASSYASSAAASAAEASIYAGWAAPHFHIDFDTMELIQEDEAARIRFYLSEDMDLMFGLTE